MRRNNLQHNNNRYQSYNGFSDRPPLERPPTPPSLTYPSKPSTFIASTKHYTPTGYAGPNTPIQKRRRHGTSYVSQQRSHNFSERRTSERNWSPPSLRRPIAPPEIARPSTPIQKRQRSATQSSGEDFLHWLPDKLRNRMQHSVLEAMARRASKLRQPQPHRLLDRTSSWAGDSGREPGVSLAELAAHPPIRVRLYRPRPQRFDSEIDTSKAHLELATEWIVTYHDSWSRLTNNPFFDCVTSNTLSTLQFRRWLLDRVSISLAILEGAIRASQLVRRSEPDEKFPLLETAKRDAKFLAEYATNHGLDINSQNRLSHEGKRLTDLIDTSTLPDGKPVIAVTAVWTYLLCSWHSWELVKSKHSVLSTDFSNIANHLKRFESLDVLLQTRKLIDSLLLSKSSPQEAENAGKMFQQVLDRTTAVLNYSLSIRGENHAPLCTCGRKGHHREQCTFKSHI